MDNIVDYRLGGNAYSLVDSTHLPIPQAVPVLRRLKLKKPGAEPPEPAELSQAFSLGP